MSNLQKLIEAKNQPQQPNQVFGSTGQPAQFSTPNTATRPYLSQLIRAERNAQGMSQRDLAKKSGVSQGTITRAETYLYVSLHTLERIAGGLGKKLTITNI